MIKFSLRCDHDHVFDSWFQSSAAFDSLKSSNMLSCPVCGSDMIKKNVMTPQVRGSTAPEREEKTPDLAKPLSRTEMAVQQLRQIVDKKFENVGRKFAAEARAMHNGEVKKRSIIGETNLREAVALIEDGIPVAPLPWSNESRRSN
ncbi:MAG: DUF1178 family protein [Rhodobacteraceae bacterium]|nr:DUF1178 family protein [Paracoccaceae bacterium]MCY4196669.1 DUF1178 family protein [Paracoccaceae bacterium]MCY4327491.1 DUF1178 family protein [Paracoccaceae bacterium]